LGSATVYVLDPALGPVGQPRYRREFAARVTGPEWNALVAAGAVAPARADVVGACDLEGCVVARPIDYEPWRPRRWWRIESLSFRRRRFGAWSCAPPEGRGCVRRGPDHRTLSRLHGRTAMPLAR